MTWRRLFFIPAMVFLALWGWAPQARAAAKWTIMAYMIGDNNMEVACINDFLEMAKVGSNDDINIVVQLDLSPLNHKDGDGYSEFYTWTTCKRFYVTQGLTPAEGNELMDLGEVNMGDSNVLRDFINWATSNYPADRYALIFVDHGNGWVGAKQRLHRALAYARTEAERVTIQKKLAELNYKIIAKEIGEDDTSGGDGLTMKELKAALTGAATKVQLLGTSCCLMGMIEVAYQIKDVGPTVMVASEETFTVAGFKYEEILSDLKANPLMTPLELGKCMVDRTLPDPVSRWDTMAATDLTRMDSLAAKVSSLADALRFPGNIDQYAVRTAAQKVMLEIGAAVYDKHGSNYPGAHGLAIYFPASASAFNGDYNSTVIDFAGGTTWDEFLREYNQPTLTMPAWVVFARMNTQQFEYIENVDLYDFCWKLVWSPVSLPEALDCPMLCWYTWSNNLPAVWKGQNITSVVGNDAAQSPPLGDNQAAWISTIATGPGTLYFYWKVSSEDKYDWLTFSIDGVPKGRISGVRDWNMETFRVPAGVHNLEWRYAKDGSNKYGQDCGWVDGVRYSIDFAHALDSPGISFTSGGNAGWFGQSRTRLVGDSAAQSGPVPNSGGHSWLETKLTGPGTLNFYWKVSSQAYRDLLKFYLDTTLVSKITGEVDWKLQRVTIPAGQHTLKWDYFKDTNNTSAGADCGWVDQVLFIPDVGLNKALDNQELTFATSAAAPWLGQTETSYYGGSAAQSPIIGDNESSWLETMVIGPGKLSFYWTVSSEPYFDWLKLTLDDTPVAQISGPPLWEKKIVDIPAGVHLVRWTYAKDKLVSKGNDCGWVDKVEYTRTGGSLDPIMLLLLDE